MTTGFFSPLTPLLLVQVLPVLDAGSLVLKDHPEYVSHPHGMQVQLLWGVPILLDVPRGRWLAGVVSSVFSLEDRPRTALKQDIGLVVTLVTTPLASFTMSLTQYSLIANIIPPNNVITNPTPTANAIGGMGSDHGYLLSTFPTRLFKIE